MGIHRSKTTGAGRSSAGFTLVELPFDMLRVVSKRKRGAFTLVELLVVIAIIGVLVATLCRRFRRHESCAALGMSEQPQADLPGDAQLRGHNERNCRRRSGSN